MKKRDNQKTVSMGAISEFQPEMTIIKITLVQNTEKDRN